MSYLSIHKFLRIMNSLAVSCDRDPMWLCAWNCNSKIAWVKGKPGGTQSHKVSTLTCSQTVDTSLSYFLREWQPKTPLWVNNMHPWNKPTKYLWSSAKQVAIFPDSLIFMCQCIHSLIFNFYDCYFIFRVWNNVKTWKDVGMTQLGVECLMPCMHCCSKS